MNYNQPLRNQHFIVCSTNWLSSNKTIAFLMVVLYSWAILYLHDPLVKITLQLKDQLTLPVFNFIVGSISVLLLLIFMALLINQLLKTPRQRSLKLFYLFTTSGLIVLHTQIMFEMSVEIIHSFEYSLLAWLIYPLFKRFGAAVVCSLPVMFIDEWLQYEVMYKGYVEYFELNDILMDVYGSGFMMVILWITGVESVGISTPWWKKTEYLYLIIKAIVIVILISTCVIVLYPSNSCNHTWLIMNQLKNPHSFWQIHPHHGSVYHVLKPIPGLIFIWLACGFFMTIDLFQGASDEKES